MKTENKTFAMETISLPAQNFSDSTNMAPLFTKSKSQLIETDSVSNASTARSSLKSINSNENINSMEDDEDMLSMPSLDDCMQL